MKQKLALITALPALVMTIIAFLPGRGVSPWGMRVATLTAFILCLGICLFRRFDRRLTSMLLTMVFAWLISVSLWVALAIADVPPCIGLNNGDGVDTLDMCVAYAVLGGIWLAILQAPLVVVSLLLAKRVIDSATAP